MSDPQGKIREYRKLSEYWDTHDASSILKDGEPVEVTVDPNLRSFVLSEEELELYLQGWLDAGEIDAIKRVAAAKGVELVDLLGKWIRDGLKADASVAA